MTSSEADERLRCAENIKCKVWMETVFRYIKKKIKLWEILLWEVAESWKLLLSFGRVSLQANLKNYTCQKSNNDTDLCCFYRHWKLACSQGIMWISAQTVQNHLIQRIFKIASKKRCQYVLLLLFTFIYCVYACVYICECGVCTHMW